MKRKHYLVPKCPHCHSNITGRYIIEITINPIETVQHYLDRGERVRIVEKMPYQNLYCEDCGISWHGKAKTIRCTKEEWRKICKQNGVDEEAFLYMLRKNTIDDKTMKIRKEAKKEKSVRIFHFFLFFFTGMHIEKKKSAEQLYVE